MQLKREKRYLVFLQGKKKDFKRSTQRLQGHDIPTRVLSLNQCHAKCSLTVPFGRSITLGICQQSRQSRVVGQSSNFGQTSSILFEQRWPVVESSTIEMKFVCEQRTCLAHVESSKCNPSTLLFRLESLTFCRCACVNLRATFIPGYVEEESWHVIQHVLDLYFMSTYISRDEQSC